MPHSPTVPRIRGQAEPSQSLQSATTDCDSQNPYPSSETQLPQEPPLPRRTPTKRGTLDPSAKAEVCVRVKAAASYYAAYTISPASPGRARPARDKECAPVEKINEALHQRYRLARRSWLTGTQPLWNFFLLRLSEHTVRPLCMFKQRSASVPRAWIATALVATATCGCAKTPQSAPEPESNMPPPSAAHPVRSTTRHPVSTAPSAARREQARNAAPRRGGAHDRRNTIPPKEDPKPTKPTGHQKGPAAKTLCIDHQKQSSDLRKTLRARYRVQQSGASLQIDFDCDNLKNDLSYVVVARGAGHAHAGASLEVWSIRPHANGGAEVTGFSLHNSASKHRDPYKRAAAGEVWLTQHTSPHKLFSSSLSRARAAVRARISEVLAPNKAGAGLGVSGFSSSSDRYIAWYLEDHSGQHFNRQFSGYLSSHNQRKVLPLTLASEAFASVLSKAKWAKKTPSKSHRADYVEAYLRLATKTRDWWIRERQLKLLGMLGNQAAYEPLIHELRGELSKRNQPRAGRSDLLYILVNAITNVTGRDLRYGSAQRPRPVRTVAMALLAAYGKKKPTH
jgi:hypothetical protein